MYLLWLTYWGRSEAECAWPRGMPQSLSPVLASTNRPSCFCVERVPFRFMEVGLKFPFLDCWTVENNSSASFTGSSHQPFALLLFCQSRETLCGEVLEGGAGGRLHQAAMQRDPPRRRAAAELQRPRPPVPHRDRHAGWRDQPEAEAGGPQLLRPGEMDVPHFLSAVFSLFCQKKKLLTGWNFEFSPTFSCQESLYGRRGS